MANRIATAGIMASSGQCGMSTKGAMITAPAADRNKGPILEVLQRYLTPENGRSLVLEIATGTGQHTAHFAPVFPHVSFVPSDYDQHLLASARAFKNASQCSNFLEPVYVDVSVPFDKWDIPAVLKAGNVDLIYNANMIHISSSGAIKGLFESAGLLLKPQIGILFTYGPYSIDGVISPESNVNFDRNLRTENPDWGLRDTRFLTDLAQQNGLNFETMYELPANNKVLIFRKS